MGAQWANDRPRPIRDGGVPWSRAETVAVSVLMAGVLILGLWASWSGGHKVQQHLDHLCATHSTVACALDGRHP